MAMPGSSLALLTVHDDVRRGSGSAMRWIGVVHVYYTDPWVLCQCFGSASAYANGRATLDDVRLMVEAFRALAQDRREAFGEFLVDLTA